MNKIKPRTKEEKTNLGQMTRENNIRKKLNTCFSNKSIDTLDEKTILEWACSNIPIEILFYWLEKIKYKRLKWVKN